jgi:hypothetical protein
MTRRHQSQGKFLGIPYDWRWPTLSRIKSRIYVPNGPLLTPKAFGWGYTLNLAHPASKWLIGAVLMIGLFAIFRS